MCVSCVSNADFLLVNGAVAAGAARAAFRRFTTPRPVRAARAAERHARAEAENVAFVASLGLDPAKVLGPAPSEPAGGGTTPVSVAR